MRPVQLLALALLAAAMAGPAHAAVKVSFANPGRYADGRLYDTNALGAIKAHLQRLGTQYLGPRDTLTITVLDLDLAGHDLSGMGPSRLRVYNGATSPKIRLRYRLERNRKVVLSGEDSLSDQMYQSRPGAALSSDVLRYEKEMLGDWFQQKFSSRRR
jgi:hypothetical protein